MEIRPPFVLASASPRRVHLLQAHGYAFETLPANVEEIHATHLSPEDIVVRNAQLKARAVSQLRPHQIVIGADTVVSFRGTTYGKPNNFEEAERMLAELNSFEHQVLTGVCLVKQSKAIELAFVETTRVQFRNLTAPQRIEYLKRIQPLDKAGAYAAQDDQGELIERISGSLSNVVGLPMEALARALKGLSEKD